ncbi:hypothetical protein BT63DRAFT_420061 [Microthyrium microscopicum]|uniref:Uncharacterized protein n=1 Tax=Microthyrium microscopicum TaxID=703497 RepID=A0A6A6UR72_9PEZI|nr:hypothetical protein BT63DRAFT_420061 [Microthyrium microscopicum]
MTAMEYIRRRNPFRSITPNLPQHEDEYSRRRSNSLNLNTSNKAGPYHKQPHFNPQYIKIEINPRRHIPPPRQSTIMWLKRFFCGIHKYILKAIWRNPARVCTVLMIALAIANLVMILVKYLKITGNTANERLDDPFFWIFIGTITGLQCLAGCILSLMYNIKHKKASKPAGGKRDDAVEEARDDLNGGGIGGVTREEPRDVVYGGGSARLDGANTGGIAPPAYNEDGKDSFESEDPRDSRDSRHGDGTGEFEREEAKESFNGGGTGAFNGGGMGGFQGEEVRSSMGGFQREEVRGGKEFFDETRYRSELP